MSFQVKPDRIPQDDFCAVECKRPGNLGNVGVVADHRPDFADAGNVRDGEFPAEADILNTSYPAP